MTISAELRPGANRPGPSALWLQFDRAVNRVGVAMEGQIMYVVAFRYAPRRPSRTRSPTCCSASHPTRASSSNHQWGVGVVSLPAVPAGLDLDQRVMRRHVAKLEAAGRLGRAPLVWGEGSVVWLTGAGGRKRSADGWNCASISSQSPTLTATQEWRRRRAASHRDRSVRLVRAGGRIAGENSSGTHGDGTFRPHAITPSSFSHRRPCPFALKLAHVSGQSPNGRPTSHSCPNGSTIRPRRQPCSSLTAAISRAPTSIARRSTASGSSTTSSTRPVEPPIASGLNRLMSGVAVDNQNAALPTASCTTRSSP
jgi:hypothetical protein